jgi:hypothetical protein
MRAKFCGTLQPAKTTAQVRCIFGLARQRGIDQDELHQLVEETTREGERPGKTSIKLLTAPEADRVIERLGGQPLQARRTVQHHRRRAGVVQIVSPAQLDLLRDLARQRHWSDDTLAEFSRRQCGHYPPRTTAEANKVIEPLKSMIKRDAA